MLLVRSGMAEPMEIQPTLRTREKPSASNGTADAARLSRSFLIYGVAIFYSTVTPPDKGVRDPAQPGLLAGGSGSIAAITRRAGSGAFGALWTLHRHRVCVSAHNWCRCDGN